MECHESLHQGRAYSVTLPSAGRWVVGASCINIALVQDVILQISTKSFWESVFTVGPRPVVLFRAVGTGCAIASCLQILERIKAKPFPMLCPPQIFRISNDPNTSPSVCPWASSC